MGLAPSSPAVSLFERIRIVISRSPGDSNRIRYQTTTRKERQINSSTEYCRRQFSVILDLRIGSGRFWMRHLLSFQGFYKTHLHWILLLAFGLQVPSMAFFAQHFGRRFIQGTPNG